MRKRTGENLVLLFFFLLGVAVFYGSWTVRVFTKEPITAKLYGCVISGLLIICILIQLVKNLCLVKKDEESGKIAVSNPVILLIMLALSLFYCYGIANIGYYTCTFVFSACAMIVLTDVRDVKHIIFNVVGSGVFCFFLSILFKLMQVYMPHTPLP